MALKVQSRIDMITEAKNSDNPFIKKLGHELDRLAFRCQWLLIANKSAYNRGFQDGTPLEDE